MLVAHASGGCEGAPARTKPWLHANGDEPSISDAVAARVHAAREKNALRNERRGLVIAVARLPAVDPKTALAIVDSPLIGPVYESLLVRRPQGLVNRLATEVRTPSALSIELVIRPHVLFHDGQGLTASDVVHSINVARQGAMAADLIDIVAVSAVGGGMVRLRLRRVNHYIPRLLAEVPIFRRASNGVWVGTGPYRLESADNDNAKSLTTKTVPEPSQLRLVAYDRYWGTPAKTPDIEFVKVDDPAEAFAGVQIGNYDIASEIPTHRGRASARGVRVLGLGAIRFRYLIFNSKRSLFADTEVRRAVSFVIDRVPIASDGLRGVGVPRQHVVWPGGPVEGAQSAIRRPRKSSAAELLDRAGWIRRHRRGSRERDGQKLFVVVVTSKSDELATDILFEQLRSAGFVLDIRRYSPVVLADIVRRGQFDLAIGEWLGGADWDLSALLESGGRLSRGGVSSLQLDRALGGLRAADGKEARSLVVDSLIVALDELVPIVTLVELRRPIALGERVRGFEQLFDRLDLTLLNREPANSSRDKEPSSKKGPHQ